MDHTWWIRHIDVLNPRYYPSNISTTSLATNTSKVRSLNDVCVASYPFSDQDLVIGDFKITNPQNEREVLYGKYELRLGSEICILNFDLSEGDDISTILDQVRHSFAPIINIHSISSSARFDVWKLIKNSDDYSNTKVLMAYGESKSIDEAYQEDNLPRDRIQRTHPVISTILTFSDSELGRVQVTYDDMSFTTLDREHQEYVIQRYERDVISDE